MFGTNLVSNMVVLGTEERLKTWEKYGWVGAVCTLVAGLGGALMMIAHAELAKAKVEVTIKGFSEIAAVSLVSATPNTATDLSLALPDACPDITTAVFTTTVYLTSTTYVTPNITHTLTAIPNLTNTSTSSIIGTPAPIQTPAAANVPTTIHTKTITETYTTQDTITVTDKPAWVPPSTTVSTITITVTQDSECRVPEWVTRELEAQGNVLSECNERLWSMLELHGLKSPAMEGILRECLAHRQEFCELGARLGVQSREKWEGYPMKKHL